MVVTTYEGQHTHPSPVVTRGAHPSQSPLGFSTPPVHVNELHIPYINGFLPMDLRQRFSDQTARNAPIMDYGGLLQDVIPRMNE